LEQTIAIEKTQKESIDVRGSRIEIDSEVGVRKAPSMREKRVMKQTQMTNNGSTKNRSPNRLECRILGRSSEEGQCANADAILVTMIAKKIDIGHRFAASIHRLHPFFVLSSETGLRFVSRQKTDVG
jgi:hypothetical protein